MESFHSVRCVVGLNLGYPQKRSSPFPRTHNVRISVWRPFVEVEEDIENMDVKQEITDQSLGEHDPDHAVAAFCLKDRLDDEMLDVIPPEIAKCEIIVILKEAEAVQETLLRETQTASRKRQAPNRNWRKRPITPEEELSESREAKYRIIELTVEQQRSDDDASYMPVARLPGRSDTGLPRRMTRSQSDA
jgi:hypothetical protein